MNFKIFTSFGLGLVLAIALVPLDSHVAQAQYTQTCRKLCSFKNGYKSCRTFCWWQDQYGNIVGAGDLPPNQVATLKELVKLNQATVYQRRQLDNYYKAVEQIRSNPTQNINRGVEINKVK
jgi:hypothetical protein